MVQVESPWQVGYVARINEMRKPLVLWRKGDNGCGRGLDRIVRNHLYRSWVRKEISRQEREAMDQVDAVIAVSDIDREALIELYGVEDRKVSVIPWGVDINKYRFFTIEEKVRAKELLYLSGKKVAVFLEGRSMNLMLKRCGLSLIWPGSLDRYAVFDCRKGRGGVYRESHPNVQFTGFVDDPVRYFAAADVGVNPMQSGGGMHFKMLEYLSSGLPTVTTELGARGLRRPWRIT